MSAQDHWRVFVINHQGQGPILRSSIFRREVLTTHSSEDKGAKDVGMDSSRGNIAFIYHSFQEMCVKIHCLYNTLFLIKISLYKRYDQAGFELFF